MALPSGTTEVHIGPTSADDVISDDRSSDDHTSVFTIDAKPRSEEVNATSNRKTDESKSKQVDSKYNSPLHESQREDLKYRLPLYESQQAVVRVPKEEGGPQPNAPDAPPSYRPPILRRPHNLNIRQNTPAAAQTSSCLPSVTVTSTSTAGLDCQALGVSAEEGADAKSLSLHGGGGSLEEDDDLDSEHRELCVINASGEQLDERKQAQASRTEGMVLLRLNI